MRTTNAPVLPLTPSRNGYADLRSIRAWGITYAMIASELSVSRQYIWQVLHGSIPASAQTQDLLRSTVESLILRQQRTWTPGRRMRSARIRSGLTLKQAATRAGYTWVAVQRWEKDLCSPKPGVLWHLRMIYGVDEDWTPIAAGQRLSA